ncbi:MAG: hypothetical protein ACI39Q_04985 [Wujia sp.]
MKKFKKAMALSLALAMGLSLVACGDKEEETTTEAPATEADTEAEDTEAADTEATADDAATAEITVPSADGAAIHVYSWNEELGSRIDSHFRTKYPELSDLVIYDNLDVSGTGEEYKTGIQNAVAADDDNVPSIVAADNDVALYFAQQDWAIPVTDAGLTMDMYKNAYQYTVDYATVDGNLMAMTWQATPGCFVYRTDVAEEVLGTSDPAEVQEYVKDWDTFLDTAAKMKEAGKYMVSGPDDLKYAFIDQKTSPWVKDGALNIDSCIEDYLNTSKVIYDEGYSLKSAMWSSEWTANMSSGDVFGYFGCTWFVQWCLAEDSHGMWNLCVGPVSYHWGGSYMLITDKCPNKELAALVVYTLCCDTDVMYDLYADDYDFPNNQESVANLIADGVGANPILNGQDPLAGWDEAAKGLSLKNATSYDATFNGYLDSAASTFWAEGQSVDDAVANIKEQVSNAYSDIAIN